MQEFIDQVERDGYAIWPKFLNSNETRRIREHMDSLLPPQADRTTPKVKRLHNLRHPIPGSIMADILKNPRLLELARGLLQAKDLRLLEQVLIRTDPHDASIGPVGATGWHVDMAFMPEHNAARPRQTYYHMVHSLSEVQPGGGGTTILPGSHHKTYAAVQKMGAEKLEEFKKDPIKTANLDLSTAIELHPREGDLLVFNPMCLHSASANNAIGPRYVYFASFFDQSAKDLKKFLADTNYKRAFPDSLRENLPAELHPLLAD